jgi:predicted AlkP superfamily pyrophosphatase or phosphodiesterase
MKRFYGFLLAVFSSVAQAQEPATRPKLVVVIVIDQFRPDYLQRFRPYFGTGGFNLFLRRGATFTEAEYKHAVTFTCPGHAVVLTGSYANVNGIISNQWYDSKSGRQEYCAADSSVTLIGSSHRGRSPRNLVASTVGDELKRTSRGRSRVIAMAGKDRSAIMLGGHKADGAYWMEDSLFVTSTHYMKELPAWVQQFNASARVSSYAGKSWDRLLPKAAYAGIGPDYVAAEQNVAGMGRTFPHRLAPDSSPRFLDGFRSSPFQNEVLLDFARAAVTSERLGEDDDPDLLAVSLSANDLIGHAFGPNSHEVMDVTVRTDRLLDRFFEFLDQQIGLRHVLIVLTADHGVAPLPEIARDLHPGAGRLDPARIAAAAETALRSRFGAPPGPGWLAHLAPPWLYLNVEALRQKGIAIEEAERTARDAVKGVRGVHQALTATELRQQQKNGMASGVLLSFYPDRSGNIYYELKPFIVPGGEPTGTTHGSPWSYDTRVPLLWFGSSIKRGAYREATSIADIAPTLSTLLGIAKPLGSRGRVLVEMLR